MSGPWGTGPWGVGPWGGGPLAGPAAEGTDEFDVFCFADSDMYQILTDPNVSTVGSGVHFVPDLTSLDLIIGSGGSYPAVDAQLIVTANIPPSFTVEWVVTFNELPLDFTDLSNHHVYLSVTDAAGPLVGLFFSKIGLAYAGSVSFPGGNLQLDTTFQVIPGSSDFVPEGEPLVIRAAADLDLGVVYLYVTRLSDLPITGQQLRAILPVIPYDVAATTPTDRGLISVRGTLTRQVQISLDTYCVGSSLIIPNLAPVANAGTDQAVRSCSIIQLNGSQSFDPEGASLLYEWRLIEAPSGSAFLIADFDGKSYPELVPTGYTTKFYSVELGVADDLDELAVGVVDGDVLVVRGEAYTIVNKGTDGNGFYVQIGDDLLLDSFLNEPFKVLRQRGLSGPSTVTPTFFPDKPGFYKFDLIVFDGALNSEPSVVLVNVLESPLPRGCTPDLSFIFTYLSDFWNLVEEREKIAVFWSALAQAAATELYSLWQVEYSKNLRDTQRVFVRRWLHYPLLLAEPLPELTRVRAIFGGITSSFIAQAGQGGINGTTLTLQSDVFEDATITIRALNPVTAERLAADLQDLLQSNVDSRFTTHVIENRSATTFAVRIDAPFPFTVTSTNCPVFAISEARPPSGTGAGVGLRIYKVDRSLELSDLKEDDFLVLDGVAYRVARVLDDATDDYAFQRVLLKEDLPTAPSTTWEISGWVTSELLDFYAGLVSRTDHVDFEVADVSGTTASTSAVHKTIATTVLGVSSTLPSRMAVDMWPLGADIANGLTTLLGRVIRRTYVPVHELVVDVPTLQELIEIVDDQAVLRRNVDFFIENYRGQNAIRFVSGQGGGASVWESSRPPFRLWAEYTYLDNRPTIESNFGIPVGLTIDQLEDLPNNVDYLSAVRGLWYAFFNGPTLRNLRVGVQILLGLPFAEVASTIEEIRTDFSPTFGRLLLRDSEKKEIVRAYQFPRSLNLEVNPETGDRYKVGDSVTEFAPLVEGAEVIDYINQPRWFEGLLNQGVFYEVEKFHKFVVRVNEAAFSLNTLLFVRSFILKIKPTYTYPLFIVQRKIKETEVSTTDQVQYTGRLFLYDSPCEGLLGASYMIDEPRAGGGGWRNQLDSNSIPLIPNGDPDPVFPTPDTEILWGLDKGFLCPEDVVVFSMCVEFAAPFTPPLDSVFLLDTPVQENMEFLYPGPPSVPVAPGSFNIPPTGGSTAPFTGTISKITFWLQGDSSNEPTDYLLLINVAGSTVQTIPFEAGINTELNVDLNLAVTSGQAIEVRIRAASGASSRSPNWEREQATLVFDEAVVWTLDDTLPAGTYCAEIPL